MKFFLDSANLAELKRAAELGIIDGVTTNPSLIAKEGVPVEEQVRKICDIVDGDISAEVVSLNATRNDRRRPPPFQDSQERCGESADGCRRNQGRGRACSKEGIRTNVTLCFSAAQALVAAKAGAYIISPFVGRVDDIGWPGIELIDNIMKIYGNYGYKTQVLAASVRGPLHVIEIAKSGVHIVTLPFKVLEQLFHHPLTDKGVEQFLSDHRKAFQVAKV